MGICCTAQAFERANSAPQLVQFRKGAQRVVFSFTANIHIAFNNSWRFGSGKARNSSRSESKSLFSTALETIASFAQPLFTEEGLHNESLSDPLEMIPLREPAPSQLKAINAVPGPSLAAIILQPSIPATGNPESELSTPVVPPTIFCMPPSASTA